MALYDDPKFRAIYEQVLKVWRAEAEGTRTDVEREQAELVTLLAKRNIPDAA